MEFSKADFLSGTGQKSFIAELMPKHPLYIDYLTPEAQAVIGQVHPQTAPARAVLEAEALRKSALLNSIEKKRLPTLSQNGEWPCSSLTPRISATTRLVKRSRKLAINRKRDFDSR